MPAKPKPKPKPSARRAAAGAVSGPLPVAADEEAEDYRQLESETMKHENTSSSLAQTSAQPAAYKTQSLFIEDESDSDETSHQAQSSLESNKHRESRSFPRGSPAEEALIEDDGTSSDDTTNLDPVVHSYDIVINSTLEEMMYLFQYPVRSKGQPYTLQEGFAPLEARMKTDTGLLELDIPISVERNYDHQKGVLYGEVLHKSRLLKSLRVNGQTEEKHGRADGSAGQDRRKRRRTGDDDYGDDDDDLPTPDHQMDFEEAKRKNRLLDRQTLSAKLQREEGNYFVGLFMEDTLHLTRLAATVQLRPQFHHIDIMSEQERANQRAMRDVNNTNATKPLEARAVNLSVKSASGDSRTLTAAEQLSKDLRQEEDEPWREIQWVDQDDDEAWQMFANVHRQSPTPLNGVLTSLEYFKWCSAPAATED